MPIDTDQERRAECGRFHCYPHHDDIVRRHCQQHGEQKQVEQAVIKADLRLVQFASLDIIANVPQRIQPDQKTYYSDDPQEHRRQGIDMQPVM